MEIRAEIRTQRDYTDEYNSYLVVIMHTDNGVKSMPYLHIPDDYDDTVMDAILAKLNATPNA